MLNQFFAAGAAASIVMVAPAAASPTADAIYDVLAWADTADGPNARQEFQEKLTKLAEEHPVSSWTLAELNIMPAQRMLFGDASIANAALERLKTFEDAESADGAAAKALTLYINMYQDRQPPEAEALKDVLGHPGMQDALANGTAARLYEVAGVMGQYMPPHMLGPARAEIEGMAKHIKPGLPAYALAPTGEYFAGMESLWEDEPEKVEALRDQIVAAMKAARSKTQSDSYIADRLDGQIKRLTFIGSEAPALTFDWTSEGLDAKTLSDLKGNVVVIDFWATWCGPCIAAFPKVREMVEHYEGYPVKVIGVTSLQGAHTTEDGERISTADDPQKEYELMSTLMGDLEITWDVAFSSQKVFNPDYFVSGIPHVAIIAPDGTIRYNGLNPHGLKPGEELEMINGILKEFELPTPDQG